MILYFARDEINDQAFEQCNSIQVHYYNIEERKETGIINLFEYETCLFSS
jgi:hypothetical protein